MEKTFREVIADIKEGEIWDSGYKEIRCYNDEIMIVSKASNSISMSFCDSTKYKLKKQLYSFAEAFKAYEEGKEIQSCTSRYRYKIIENSDAVYIRETSHWLTLTKEDEIISFHEIRGKWYINN